MNLSVLLFILFGVIFGCWISPLEGGKILASLASVELGDYRMDQGAPYVAFYERENYRGKVHFHRLSMKCTNLNSERLNWASSVDLQRHCVTLCDKLDCLGNCRRVTPDVPPKSTKGVARLQDYGLNDKVASIKFCY